MHIFRLNRKRNQASRVATLRRNAFRLLFPLILAGLATALWYYFHTRGWHVSNKADAMLSNAILVHAALFAIAAAITMNNVWERLRTLSRLLLTQDKHTFMLVRDEKIPIAMHLALAVFGIWVVVLLAAAEYPTAASGGLIIFSVCYGMSLYFVVILELQEPTTSVWFATRIPKDWLIEMVDDYFKVLEQNDERR